MNKDLTVGEPKKIMWRFCLPLFGSVIFQQMYNIADSWVAGRYIDENALAAVGNSYEITLIFIAFAFGCNIGCSVITSRFFGSKSFTEMKTAVNTALISSAATCITLMLLGLFFGERLLLLINTPVSLLPDSELYLNIYVWGLPFVFFYNLSTGIFSALGDSKTPFWFLAASSLSNIAMDIVFVKYLHMGVAGVAWATFICQGVSCLLAVTFVFRRLGKIKTDAKPKLFAGAIFKQFVIVAVPSILQQSFISVGNIIIQGVINSFGEGFKEGLRLIWILCIPFCLLYFIFPGVLVKFFLKVPSEEALRSATLFLRILAPFYFVAAVKLVSDGVLRGASKMKSFTTATFTDLILRVVLAAILSRTALGYVGIWTAWPIGWIVGTVISVSFYVHCRFVKIDTTESKID